MLELHICFPIRWIDSISASSAVYFFIGLGILKYMQGNGDNIGDQVPVDFVSDFIIVAGAAMANSKKLEVFNCAAS